MSGKHAKGISQTTFVAGLVAAILTSSLISTAIAMQWVVIQGPKGEKGDTGPQGEQGPQGSSGVFTVENLSGWLSAPAYDSGWVQTGVDILTFDHNLGTTEVFVYLVGRDEPWDTYGINIRSIGLYLFWCNLTTSQISVHGSFN